MQHVLIVKNKKINWKLISVDNVFRSSESKQNGIGFKYAKKFLCQENWSLTNNNEWVEISE